MSKVNGNVYLKLIVTALEGLAIIHELNNTIRSTHSVLTGGHFAGFLSNMLKYV